MASLEAELNTLKKPTVAACDQAAKAALTASKDKLVLGVAAIDKAIQQKKDVLLQATGEGYVAAVSTNVNVVATTAVTNATMAAATTPGSATNATV